MAWQKKYNTVVINIMLAAVACLVVNFSYLLTIREQNSRDIGEAPRWLPEGQDAPHTGVLHVSADGYGYVICDDFPDGHTDSIYVVSRLIRRLDLRAGSRMTVIARDSDVPGANQLMWRVLEVDGEVFDYGALYDQRSDRQGTAIQLVFYFVFAFVLLTVMTVGRMRHAGTRLYLTRAEYCVAIAVVAWLVLPKSFYPIDLLKCLFVLALALLYGRTYQLISQRESIVLENEQLRSENLAARLNTLVGQINPHFLFNSLNSLSSLVREGRSEDAVRYIDRLSDTFRYTIQSEPGATTTLGEELQFVEAYKYLLEVRYDEKLSVAIDVEPGKLSWKLPTFSIQPLVENAVKHNTISRQRPLRVTIRTEGDRLVVSNPVNPKLEPERGTGIGLANLAKRWQLLTGRTIEVVDDGVTFTVKLPFIR